MNLLSPLTLAALKKEVLEVIVSVTNYKISDEIPPTQAFHWFHPSIT